MVLARRRRFFLCFVAQNIKSEQFLEENSKKLYCESWNSQKIIRKMTQPILSIRKFPDVLPEKHWFLLEMEVTADLRSSIS